MKLFLKVFPATLILALAAGTITALAQSDIPGANAEGRWDITVQTPEGDLPSWLEIEVSGNKALVGRFVGPVGSVRPVSDIRYDADSETYSFSIPPQWNAYEEDPYFEFSLEGGKLKGWTNSPEGQKLQWTGERAPSLDREEEPEWGEPVDLLDEELSAWELPENNEFVVENGILTNRKSGGNLITRQAFDDFRLRAEFRYPEGSNSGIYLRGRYEVQIEDSFGMEPESHHIGGIYGFIDPTVNAAKRAGEWQTYEITLTGRMVTVVLNGIEVICNRPIPGITGGALNSREGEPGPVMLQGDHGPIEFRNITITPAVN
jgi:hypothetical protein